MNVVTLKETSQIIALMLLLTQLAKQIVETDRLSFMHNLMVDDRFFYTTVES